MCIDRLFLKLCAGKQFAPPQAYGKNELVAGAEVNQLVQYATKVVELVLAVFVIVTGYRQKAMFAEPARVVQKLV